MRIFKNYTDEEMLSLLRESSSNLTIIDKKHRDYCLKFMYSIDANKEQNQDVYHDALLVLFEKNRDPKFKLSCSIQTYLNSICRNQILIRFKNNKRTQSNDPKDFDENITDWFETIEDEGSERINALMKALKKLEDLGGKCYEIIKRYFYEKQKLDKIAVDLGYTNADNVANQKSRCQKRLKELHLEIADK